VRYAGSEENDRTLKNILDQIDGMTEGRQVCNHNQHGHEIDRQQPYFRDSGVLFQPGSEVQLFALDLVGSSDPYAKRL